MRRFYAVFGALCILAVLLYALLPERRFAESVYPIADSVLLTAYDDRGDGGQSTASMALEDSVLNFSCTLHTGDAPAWCGMLFDFVPDSALQYRNWKLVDTLVLNVEVSGTDEFLIKVWTFDPDVTKFKDKFTFRPLIKEVKVHGGLERIAIPMAELYVPEYWFTDQHINRNLELKHEESVAKFEITAGWNAKRGEPFSIKIHSIEACGVSSLALGMVLFFFLGVALVVVGVRHEVREGDSKK